jgi:hypothetical protein
MSGAVRCRNEKQLDNLQQAARKHFYDKAVICPLDLRHKDRRPLTQIRDDCFDLGLVFNPFTRTLHPMKLLLA